MLYVYVIHLGDGKHKRGVCEDPRVVMKKVRKVSGPNAEMWLLHLYQPGCAKKIAGWLVKMLSDTGCEYWRKQSAAQVRAWCDKIVGMPPLKGCELESADLMAECNRV
jgi:hypothetical protein